MSAADASTPRRRWRVRFSLRTLLVATVVVGSFAALWMKRVPWVMSRRLQTPTYSEFRANHQWSLSPDRQHIVKFGPKEWMVIDVASLSITEHGTCERDQEWPDWSDDSRRIVTHDRYDKSGDPEPYYNIWNASPFRIVLKLPVKPDWRIQTLNWGCALSSDSKYAFTGLRFTSCVNVETNARKWDTAVDFSQLMLDSSGRFLFTGKNILDTSAGKIVWSAGEDALRGHLFSRDGRYFALTTVAPNSTLQIYDTTNFIRICNEPLNEREGQTVHFSPNGNIVVETFATLDGRSEGVEIRKTFGGELIQRIEKRGAVYATISPDSSLLAVGGFGQDDWELYELPSGKSLHAIEDFPQFSPDNTRILTTASADRVRVFDIKTGDHLLTINEVSWARWVNADSIICEYKGEFTLWSRLRPEGQLGFLALPEFWAALLSFIGVIFSLRVDQRKKAAA